MWISSGVVKISEKSFNLSRGSRYGTELRANSVNPVNLSIHQPLNNSTIKTNPTGKKHWIFHPTTF
jgi:hypothetical protein